MINGSLKIMHNFIKKVFQTWNYQKIIVTKNVLLRMKKKYQIFEVEILALFDKLPFIVFSNHKNSFESIDFCQKILLFLGLTITRNSINELTLMYLIFISKLSLNFELKF